MGNLDASIREPTPYYETQITVDRNAAGGGIVHDRDIVYGPWLETGAGRVTRFHGYRSFGRAQDGIAAKIRRLLQAAVGRMVRRLGGR
jgi:hypothetical protein